MTTLTALFALTPCQPVRQRAAGRRADVALCRVASNGVRPGDIMPDIAAQSASAPRAAASSIEKSQS
jgi:hypothetical protein